MTKNYLFAPIIFLLMLIASLLGGYAYGQNASEPVKTIKIKKEIKSEGDSVKVIIKTIEGNEDHDINIDSVLNSTLFKGNGKQHKFIKIINGDTIITNYGNDTLASVWIDRIHIDQLADFESEIESHMEFLKDSCMQFSFSFDFDSMSDPIHLMQNAFIFDEDCNPLKMEKFVDIEYLSDSIEKQVRLIISEMDREMVTIEDFDDNTIVYKHQRILIDNLTEEDKNTLGYKSSKEPDFEFFKLHPNPSANAVNVNFKLAEPGKVEVKVMNLKGQLVYEMKMNNLDKEFNESIELSHKTGPFVLQIIQGNKMLSRKILIEK